jgi:chorismate synthase
MQGIEDENIKTLEDIKQLADAQFPMLNERAKEQAIEVIETLSKEGDSVGGVLETVVLGMPAGVGEPWFDSMESTLSHALFSIPGVKGVEFGLGFAFADVNGELANDQFSIEDNKVVTKTNNNGGINGGISNGMPIVFRSVVKPTPSIYKEQSSVNLSKMEEQTLIVNGRHDPAIIHRARVVVDSLTAFVLADMLTTRFGTDYLAKEGK